jgi:transposase
MEPGKRYVGLDMAKRIVEVCVAQDGEAAIERASGKKTDAKGREHLARMLTKTGLVGMEAYD